MGLLKKTGNAKITEIEGKIPSITGSAKTTVLNTVENIILVGDLVNKANYDAKISDTEAKYFTTSDYNKFMNEMLDKKIKEKKLVDKSEISEFKTMI